MNFDDLLRMAQTRRRTVSAVSSREGLGVAGDLSSADWAPAQTLVHESGVAVLGLVCFCGGPRMRRRA